MISPTIGIHRDVPADTYHQWGAIGSTNLSQLARSPAHFRHARDNPAEPTPAQVIGDAAHLCILQPDLFPSRYVVAPECDRRTKEGKASYAAFCELNAGKTSIKSDDWAACQAMRDAVMAHPMARLLLEEQTGVEVSGAWRCPDTGVACKLRADALCATDSVAVDLKTTTDASPAAFERAIFQYGYWRQAAHYVHGLAALGCVVDSFVIVAVEKDPPHAVGVYRVLDDVLAMGHDDAVRQLEKYKRCEASGCWPAYGDGIKDIGIPRWAMRDLEGQFTNEGSAVL